ncbi:hypothetical protein [Virgibacillus salexigens]|uniref:YfhE family protein n=1 Tax=Virgibacillus kapii TaxID=1638645 RepID=A0ABQ2DCI0_9BACI|nr:hypothetical protein [Virgibacillus kapii]GGJ51273.1 hypothetical protein GCM10007111_11840 [Virgibacillus kapii]
MIKSRKERRKEAKENKIQFQPNYNGGGLVTHEEQYGVGYERFNSKHVTIKEETNNE